MVVPVVVLVPVVVTMIVPMAVVVAMIADRLLNSVSGMESSLWQHTYIFVVVVVHFLLVAV